jgi:Tfp pilus assembly protein PilF
MPARRQLPVTFRGQREDAAAEYRRAVELDPNNASVHNNLGLALYHQGNADAAITEYRRAIDTNPKFALAQQFGQRPPRPGKTDDAVAEYRRAIETEPNYRNARDNMEKALEAKSAAK